MALTPSDAKAAVRSKIDSLFGPIDSSLQSSEITALNQARDKMAESIASVVTYIQQNATVSSTVLSVSGVTAGPGVSGPGTATGTIL